MTEATSQHANVLRRLLFLVFMYAGIAYGLSLLEYTLFNLTGWSPVSVARSVQVTTPDDIDLEFRQCGSPLFAANAVTTESVDQPILARCGRFWPFYYHTIEINAHPLIPGAFIEFKDESDEAKTAREDFILKMQVINGGFAVVSLFILGLCGMAIYRFVVKRDEEGAYKTGFHAFISSFLMLACFTGLMFFVDPTFGYGW
ncbi:hypothetical protein [Hahella ganghwensis]|uniref:hypothetical protein n=1 Tax=Hahella ganghwensis TaxID=286420 RepID=UPI00035DBDCE|nr:hypothetical protein [Hahella ganghwensis]